MKKIIALALALIMVLSMASVAFADDPAYVAEVNGTKYTDLEEAIKAAAPAGTVEILSDVTVDEWNMFSQRLTIASGKLVTLDMNGLTINGNGHKLTVNSIESARNGNQLFHEAENLNINNWTINVPNGGGGIGLQSGVIDNVTFDGGSGIFPGTGDITIKNCEFNTDNHVIYYENALDNLVVTNNVFNPAANANVIILRGGETFTGNNVVSGRTVNIVSDTATVTGNTFNTRVKLYTDGTTLSGNNFEDAAYIELNDNSASGPVVADPSSIDLSSNYWGGGAPAAGQVPAGAVVDNYYTSPVGNVSTGDTNPGKTIIASTNYARADWKVKSYDFTTGTKDYRGASYIDEIKINKDNELVIVLKDNYKLAVDKSVKGEIILQSKADKTVTVTIPVEYNVKNIVEEISGAKRVKDVDGYEIDPGENKVFIMDEDGGYVSFQEEMLKGVVKMNKEEKTFLNLIYGGQEETVEAIEEILGEEYLDEAIIEYYEFETRAFKNEVAFSYEAYEDDPHYFYLYNDGKLTKIDVTYDDDEDVEAWVWTAIAEGTIIVTDVEIVLAEEETKNPDTGANDVVGIAAALAVTSLVAAAAISIKK